MEQVSKYVLSLVCAAVLSGIVTRLPCQDTFLKKLIQTVAGIFVLFTLIQPFSGIKIKDPASWLEELSMDGKDAAAEGEKWTNNALQQSIKNQIEAYILDKAATIGASLEVEVVMSKDSLPVPVSVVLNGDISPYDKVQMAGILERELGITGENQIWK